MTNSNGVGGSNLEAHFEGELVNEITTPLAASQQERDAHFFSQRALLGTSVPTTITPELTGAVVDPGFQNLAIKVGTTTTNRVVVVTGVLDQCPPILNDADLISPSAIGGVVVELTVLPSTGLAIISANTASGYSQSGRYVAVADASGAARVSFSGVAVGTYSVQLTVRQLVPDGAAQGPALVQQNFQVQVIP